MNFTSLEDVEKHFLKKAERFVDVHRKVASSKKDFTVLNEKEDFIIDKDGNKVLGIGVHLSKSKPDEWLQKHEDISNAPAWFVSYTVFWVNKEGEEIDGEPWWFYEDDSYGIKVTEAESCHHNKSNPEDQDIYSTKDDLSTVVVKDILSVLWYNLEESIRYAFDVHLAEINAGTRVAVQAPTLQEYFDRLKASGQDKKLIPKSPDLTRAIKNTKKQEEQMKKDEEEGREISYYK